MTRTAIEIRWIAASANRPQRLQARTMSARPVSVTVSVHRIPNELDTDYLRFQFVLGELLKQLGDGWGSSQDWIGGATNEGRVFVRMYREVCR